MDARGHRQPMSLPFVPTQLSVPFLPAACLPRPHLIQALDDGLAAGRKLSLVTAPTGSGKTTLLSAWARSAGAGRPAPWASARFCWLTLEAADDDPAAFWSGCTAALGAQRPGLREAMQALWPGDPLRPLPLKVGLACLIERLTQDSQRLILVLDDYHVIHAARIHAALVYLLEHLPPQLHLALASRSEPPLELARQRARGQLTELRMEALSFTRAEAADFLGTTMRLSLRPEEVQALEQRTEGWAAGLQLAGLALQASRPPAPPGAPPPDLTAFVQAFGGSHRHVADYLTSEVLQHQPAPLYAFLLQTSILGRLSAELCAAVIGAAEAQATLEHLERANLFVVPLDGDRRWYRYHTLWAEVLQARLLREQPEASLALHRRASAWFEQHGFWAEAVTHALQGGDVQRAAELMGPAARPMVMRGESNLLLGWLEKLPPDLIASRADLVIAQAWAWLIVGRLDDVSALVERLAAGGPAALQGEVAAMRAIVATVRQDVAAIQQEAALALQYLPAQEDTLRCAVALSLGTAAALSGDEGQAAALLEQALHESQRGQQPLIRLMAAITLAQAYEVMGRLTRAAQLHRQVMALEADPVLGSLPLIGVGYVGLGGILHERLQFAEAEATLERGMTIGLRWGSPEILLGGYFSLARLRYTQGRLVEALELLDKLEAEFWHASPQRERIHILSFRARLWLAQGRLALVEGWARANNLETGAPANYADESQHLVFARVLLARRQPAQALERLAALEENARRGQRAASLMEILVLQALARHTLGQGALAQTCLAQALALGAADNGCRAFLDEPELRPLLQAYSRHHPSDVFAASLLSAFEARAAALQAPAALLSDRELDVLRLMALGLSNQTIAHQLVVALSTVKSHVKSILKKLDAQNRTQAVTRARELNLL